MKNPNYVLVITALLIICGVCWAEESSVEAFRVLPDNSKDGILLEVQEKQYRVESVKLSDFAQSCRIISQDNFNTRFMIVLKPVPFPSNGFHGLILKGNDFTVISNGHGATEDMVDSITFDTEALAAAKVAKAFNVKPHLRKHPGHKLQARFICDEVLTNTVVTLEITNVGDNTVEFQDGGMNRGMRNNQFGFIGFRDLEPMPDIGSPMHMGGWSTTVILDKGDVFTKEVDLAKWFDLSKEDYYDITGTFYLEFQNPDVDFQILWTDYVVARFQFVIQEDEEPEKADNPVKELFKNKESSKEISKQILVDLANEYGARSRDAQILLMEMGVYVGGMPETPEPEKAYFAKEYAKAEALYKEEIISLKYVYVERELFRDLTRAHYYLAWSCFHQGKYETAITTFKDGYIPFIDEYLADTESFKHSYFFANRKSWLHVAGAFHKKEKSDKSEMLYQEALEGYNRILDPGMKSPNGEYVIEYIDAPPHTANVNIKETATGKVLLNTCSSGYGTGKFEEIGWSSDSKYLAVVSRGTKTSSHIEIYRFNGNDVKKIELPEYRSNLLGRQNKFEGGRYRFVDDIYWNKHNDLSFMASGNFSNGASHPQDNPEDWYNYYVVFNIENDKARFKWAEERNR